MNVERDERVNWGMENGKRISAKRMMTMTNVGRSMKRENSSDVSFVGFPFAPDLKLDLC